MILVANADVRLVWPEELVSAVPQVFGTIQAKAVFVSEFKIN